MKITQKDLPKEVTRITEALNKANHKAFLVGGCVRDLLRGSKPKDWDITTDAEPKEIEGLFEHTFYENDYGTVTVVNDDTEDATLKNIEITPFRLEASYTNRRHPDEVKFSKDINDDLKRRDFTVNAIAFDPVQGQTEDPFKGRVDIDNKLLRAVGDPNERFQEDALRIMRAVRLAVELDFEISRETHEAIVENAYLINEIAVERVRDEFIRIVSSKNAMRGIEMLSELGILKNIIPELEEGIGVEQNGEHIYTVWEHNLRAMQNGADKDWPLHIRLGALFHDVGKPKTRRFDKEKNDYTFYGHEVVGAKMTAKIMARLRFGNDISDVVTKLVRWHMFFCDIDQITLSAVRRLVANVGPENVADLMKIRVCDRKGMGRPKERPYRLRKYESMVEEAMRDPVSVKMLKLNGDEMIANMNFKPGPRMGWILHALLEEVLDDPAKNTEKYLKDKALELDKMPDAQLRELGEAGVNAREKEEAREVGEIRKKYFVK